MALALCAFPATAPLRATTDQDPRGVVDALDIRDVEGEWFEIATSASWSKRRCVSDTRYVFRASGRLALDVRRACTTPTGEERRQGRLAAAADGSGALRLRLTPAVFSWLPAAWEDFWVLARASDGSWMLVGDRRRDAVAVLSRTVALDEAAFAASLAEMRRRGLDIGRLLPVPHPAGAWGLRP
jgi:apolipoprotein D and lipocalin family protein